MTATRSTRYQEIPVDDNFMDVVYEPREVSMNSQAVQLNMRETGGEVEKPLVL